MEKEAWKAKKELFVSNLSGTSLFEIFIITSYLPVIHLLRVILLSWIPHKFAKHNLFCYLVDFATLVFPIILTVTELSECLFPVLMSIIVFEISIFMILPRKKISTISNDDAYSSNTTSTLTSRSNAGQINGVECKQDVSSILNLTELSLINVISYDLPFVRGFRTFVSVFTCVCILAVDFNVFPRRLAKTELFGTGLMDVGVGFYILSNAIVCKEARANFPSSVVCKYQTSFLNWSNLLFQLKTTCPILLIGVIRLVSVKLFCYQEHISEYGVHWNFFFTLASVKILSSVVFFCMSSKLSLIMSVAIGLSYQFILSFPYIDATAILTNSNRDGILMQNKEGLASCLGYLSLYFAGVHLGSFLFRPRRDLHEWFVVFLKLLIASLVLWLLVYACETNIQRISRRLANLSYVVWLMSLTVSLLSAAIFSEILVNLYMLKNYLPPHSRADKWINLTALSTKDNCNANEVANVSLCLFYAINRNQLLYFLLCNLLTGLTNNVVDTIAVGKYMSIAILCGYQCISTLFLWYLHVNNITLKFFKRPKK